MTEHNPPSEVFQCAECGHIQLYGGMCRSCGREEWTDPPEDSVMVEFLRECEKVLRGG